MSDDDVIPPESVFIAGQYDRMIATEDGRLLAPLVERLTQDDAYEYLHMSRDEIARKVVLALNDAFGLCPSWRIFSVGLGETGDKEADEE